MTRSTSSRNNPNSVFVSLLNSGTRDTFESVAEAGIREWPASGAYSTDDDGLTHLFYVLDGILACTRSNRLTRILPREVLRVGSSDRRTLENPSRADSTTALHLTLVPSDNTPLSTRHHYFSDDEKDNKLCKVAAFDRDGRTLAVRAPVEIYLSTLGRYDTVIIERDVSQPLLILCARGKATVNAQAVFEGDNALSIETDTATVTGLKPCTILTIRGQNA